MLGDFPDRHREWLAAVEAIKVRLGALALNDGVTLLAQTFLDADDVVLPAEKPDHDICALLASLPRGIMETLFLLGYVRATEACPARRSKILF
jgi:hypothetical protein